MYTVVNICNLLLKTSKNEDLLLFHNFKYYYKRTNKNGSQYWVCLEDKYSASLTVNDRSIENTVIKINGKVPSNELLIGDTVKVTHNHEPLTNNKIIVRRELQNMKISNSQTNRKVKIFRIKYNIYFNEN